jgi:hypothetical protein
MRPQPCIRATPYGVSGWMTWMSESSYCMSVTNGI